MMLSESAIGYRRSGLALLVFFVLLGAILTRLGAPSFAGDPWDSVVLLNAGWRILNGQVPYVDFHVPVGPLTYLLAAFGMRIVPPSASAPTYGCVLFAALLLPCAWYIASSRLSCAFSFIVVLSEGFLLLTPRALGYPIRYTTYAEIYNRYGYALISLLLLCMFLKPRNSGGARLLLEGSLAGVILALILYCKITYFLAAAALTLIAIILHARPRPWYLAFAGAFVGICLGFFLLFHISLYSYALDIISAGLVQSPTLRMTLLLQALHNNAVRIYIVVFCCGLCTLATGMLERKCVSAIRLCLVAGSIVASALLIVSGNASQIGGLDDPIYFLAALIFLELFRRQNIEEIVKSHTTARWAYLASGTLVLPICCGTILARDIASCAYAIKWNLEGRRAYSSSQRIHSTNLRDFYIAPSVGESAVYWPLHDFPEKINDGIELLRRNLQTGDRVATIAFTNPFPFALGLPPTKGGLLFWDIGFSFDQSHFPPPDQFLGNASLVMVPNLTTRSNLACCFQSFDLMQKIYEGYLRSHFHEIASTDTWLLYRRNQARRPHTEP